jgi:hypothetical protein
MIHRKERKEHKEILTTKSRGTAWSGKWFRNPFSFFVFLVFFVANSRFQV